MDLKRRVFDLKELMKKKEALVKETGLSDKAMKDLKLSLAFELQKAEKVKAYDVLKEIEKEVKVLNEVALLTAKNADAKDYFVISIENPERESIMSYNNEDYFDITFRFNNGWELESLDYADGQKNFSFNRDKPEDLGISVSRKITDCKDFILDEAKRVVESRVESLIRETEKSIGDILVAYCDLGAHYNSSDEEVKFLADTKKEEVLFLTKGISQDTDIDDPKKLIELMRDYDGRF